MRHKIHDKKFNRDSNAREALFEGLLRNLTLHGEITTTLAKAKAIRGMADKLVTQAKDNSLASRRLLHQKFGKRDVANTLVDRIAPALTDRTSGYVRVVPLGNRRGDNTPMAKVSFVNKPAAGGLKSGKKFNKPSKAEKVAKAVKPVEKVKPAKKKAAAPKKAVKK